MYLVPEPISCAKEMTFESGLLTPLTNTGLVMSAHETLIKFTAAEEPSEPLKNNKTVAPSAPPLTTSLVSTDEEIVDCTRKEIVINSPRDVETVLILLLMNTYFYLF